MKKYSLKESEIYPKGLEQLALILEKHEEIARWKDRLAELSSEKDFEENAFVWLSCVEALEAVSEGNFGVGALIVNEKQEVILRGHNMSFVPKYRSELHAEMVLLNAWEQELKAYEQDKNLDFKLYSSLEPCPMCLTRLLYSNIKGIHYASNDDEGGMTRNLAAMPPYFRMLAKRHEIAQAKASPVLLKAAREIMNIGLDGLNSRMI